MTLPQIAIADEFGVAIHRDGATIAVGVYGELDMATVPELRTHLVDLIDGQGNLSVTLDLSRMTFIDSIGLGLLVGTFKRMRDRGGSLVLRRPTAATARVLAMTGLDQMIPVTD